MHINICACVYRCIEYRQCVLSFSCHERGVRNNGLRALREANEGVTVPTTLVPKGTSLHIIEP